MYGRMRAPASVCVWVLRACTEPQSIRRLDEAEGDTNLNVITKLCRYYADSSNDAETSLIENDVCWDADVNANVCRPKQVVLFIKLECLAQRKRDHGSLQT